MTRTFWLSFCDPCLAADDQFLGVSVVEVDEDDLQEARARLQLRGITDPSDDQVWLAAATMQAHRMGCNPGGEIRAEDITPVIKYFAHVPRHRLLRRRELQSFQLHL